MGLRKKSASLLTEPLIHFLVIGVLVYCLYDYFGNQPVESLDAITVTAAEVETDNGPLGIFRQPVLGLLGRFRGRPLRGNAQRAGGQDERCQQEGLQCLHGWSAPAEFKGKVG